MVLCCLLGGCIQLLHYPFHRSNVIAAPKNTVIFVKKSPTLTCRNRPLLSLGLLKVGVPQPWEKSKKNLSYVRQAGVRQFISTYNRVKDLRGDELLWGDEIEYGIFALDDKDKKIRLSLRAKEVSLEESLNRV